MKKTWKQLLGTLAGGAAIGTLALGTLMGPVFGQSENDGVVVLGRGAPQSAVAPEDQSGEGSVRLGVQPTAGVNAQPASAGMPVEAAPPQSVFVQHAPTIHPTGVPSGGGYAPGESVGYAVTEDPADVLLRVGRRNGDVYGINGGFTSIAAYLSHCESCSSVWFVEPRLLLTDHGEGGLNVGFGQKAYYPELDRVFSLSGWWDYDAGHVGDYHQVGLSFEMIGQNMSLRSNAYFVVSKDERRVTTTNIGAPIPTDDGMLVQQQIAFTEVAYNQADVEVSMPMPLAGDYGWEWGGGAYFLFGGDGRDATGVKGRIESQVTEDLWVNALISSDRVFDTNLSVNLEFTIPHAPPSKWFRRPSVRDHLWASVRRYHRVATTVVQQMQTTPVMGMGSNGQMQQLRLGLIDPNVTDDPLMAFGGTGTSDDPWRSVADYMDEALSTQEQFGIIAVRSRDDETDLNLNTTIVLLDNQALLGEGVMHSLDGGITPIDIPTLDPNGMRPLLSNSAAPGANVVTLANNNQVSGFFIDGTGTGSGIVGDGVRGFNINQVEMSNVIDGIRIRSVSNATGAIGLVQNNVITGIGLGSPRGISIEHESGVLGLLVSNNSVNDFRGEDANQNGMLDPSEDVNNNGVLDPGEDIDFDGRLDLSEDLNGNGVLDAGFGLYVSAANGSEILANDPDSMTIPLGILTNTLDGNGTGMSMIATGGSTITANIEGNIASGSTDVGEDSNGNQVLDPGEDINGNGVLEFGAGFRVFADDSTISLLTFTDNSATDGFGNGGTFQTLNGGAINVVNPNIDPDTLEPGLAFARNTFSDNDLDGLFVQSDSGSIIFDQIQESFFDGNGDDGLDLETTNAGTIFIRDPLLLNSFTMNGDNGIEVTSGIGGGISLTLGGGGAGTANTITGNGQNAIPDTGAGIFLGTAGGVLNATFSGLVSTGNSGSGAVIFLDGGMINIDGGITDNTFVDNGEHGLAIINNNGGRFITPFVSDNNFSNNAMAGLFLGGTGPAPSDGPPTATAVTDLGSVTRNNFNRDIRGDEGILIDASDLRIMGTLTQNTFIGRRPTVNAGGIVTESGAGRGIGGTISGSSTLPAPGGLSLIIGTVVDSDQNTFQDNGDAHIGLEMAGNTVNSILVENGSFSNAFDRRVVGLADTAPPSGQYQGEGIHYVLEDTAILTGGVTDSVLSGNEGDGLLIEVSGNNDAGNASIFTAAQVNNFFITDSEFVANGVDRRPAANGVLADGIQIRRTERGQFNDLLIAGNLITNNTDNGIQITSSGVDMLNIENMRADTVTIEGNEITGNLRDGIEFLLGADADLAVRMDGNLIVENGVGEVVVPSSFMFPNTVPPGTIPFGVGPFGAGDVGNGVQIREQIQSANDSRSLTGLWTNNDISDNFDDGIDISGRIGNTLVEMNEAGDYTIAPPPPGTMLPYLGLVRSWGLVIGDPTVQSAVGIIGPEFNLINDNGGDGIDITAQGVGTIGNNIITGNGTIPNATQIFHAGINIDGAEQGPGQAGSFTGQFPTPNSDIDPDLLAFRELWVISNLISRNNGDGIELLSEPSIEFTQSPQSPGFIETALTIVRNEITLNQGRGIDILQRTGDADGLDRDNQDPDGIPAPLGFRGTFATDVTISANHVKGNQLEGIYVVQSIDDAQNQVDPSALASNANGESLRAQAPENAQGNRPQLRFDVHENNVIGNGEGLIDFPSSGLVIRVGTSGGSSVLFSFGVNPLIPRLANFFATSGFNLEDVDGDGLLDNDLDGDGFLDAAVVTGAGVSTSITENVFAGNYGDDVLFQSFTDTVNPNQTQGNWNPMEFTPMAFQPDPLSRMDVIFSLNVVESIEANNRENSIGTSPGNGVAGDEPGALGPLAGAYYDNTENLFKSRLNNIMDLPGPYADARRPRNATRFASRWLSGPFILPPDPLISPDDGAFAYPGMGNSTFRARGSGNFYQIGNSQVPFILSDAFIFDIPELAGDPDLVDAFGEAQGVLGPGDSEPWGWDDLEVQTSFDIDYFVP